MTESDTPREHQATCGCGALTATASGEPLQVVACSCLNCQKESGSAFTYSAVFPEAAVRLAGPRKLWRRTVDSGRWLESEFCPTCGVTVCFRMQAWPGTIGVSAGCFADPDFAGPDTLFWASRRHRWLPVPEGMALVETQAD